MESRRTVLATLGTALAAGGCLDGLTGGPAADDTPSPGGTDTPPSGTEMPPGGSDTPPGTPTPGRLDVDCPSFAGTDGTVCADAVPPEMGIIPEASSRRFKPVSGNDAVETITFTLHNETGNPFTLNPHAWSLHRLEQGQWRHVAPDEHLDPLVELPRGAAYEWVLSRESHPTPNAERTLYPTVAVQNGVHAFAVDGWVGDAETPEADRITVEAIALFEVQRVWADPGETSTESP